MPRKSFVGEKPSSKLTLEAKWYHQASTIGVRRVRTYAYFYWRTYDFGHTYIETYAYFFPYDFFKVFKICLVLIILYCLKTHCYIFDLYLFALGRGRFCTVYICFKETFFNFSYKILNKYFSLPQSTCQFRVSVRK